MNKKIITISIIMLVALVSMVSTASATGTITIYPNTTPINVGVYPNSVSPPLEVVFDGWDTTNYTVYSILVQKVWIDGQPIPITPTECMFSMTTNTSGPHTLTLPNCTIPASDVGAAYKVYAQAGSQTNEVYLEVITPVVPVPELNTGILTMAGLIGLLGIVKFNRKN